MCAAYVVETIVVMDVMAFRILTKWLIIVDCVEEIIVVVVCNIYGPICFVCTYRSSCYFFLYYFFFLKKAANTTCLGNGGECSNNGDCTGSVC